MLTKYGDAQPIQVVNVPELDEEEVKEKLEILKDKNDNVESVEHILSHIKTEKA